MAVMFPYCITDGFIIFLVNLQVKLLKIVNRVRVGSRNNVTHPVQTPPSSFLATAGFSSSFTRIFRPSRCPGDQFVHLLVYEIRKHRLCKRYLQVQVSVKFHILRQKFQGFEKELSVLNWPFKNPELFNDSCLTGTPCHSYGRNIFESPQTRLPAGSQVLPAWSWLLHRCGV